MKKDIYSFTFLNIVLLFFSANLFANKLSSNYGLLISTVANVDRSLFFAPPTAPIVQSPIYYCQNSSASPLTATADPGNTLIWYGTSATSGTPTITAPTPSTTTVGATTYYVSQTDGATVSPRAQIVVNVVADNGSKILLLRCDRSQIQAPSTIYDAVFFDWTNTPGIPNQYTYSYSVGGAPPIFGTKNNGTNLQVSGLSPGQSVTLTVLHTTYPCDRSIVTCTVPCLTTTTPTFSPISPVCQNSIAPTLPSASNEGITGTWSPASINSSVTGTVVHTFTPDPVAYPCAVTTTMSISVIANVSPTFTSIPTTVCQNATAPILPTNSNNTPTISGTWSPSTVNTTALGATDYIFTPNSGQCTPNGTTTVRITIIANNSPNFSAIPPLCSGSTAPILATTSPTGVTGSWSPSTINNTTNGSYLFTPNPNQCSSTQTLNVTITPRATPNFAAIPAICSGDPAPTLAPTSPNGVMGTWTPAAINSSTSGSYVFTPNANECANSQTLNVAITPRLDPGFSSFIICSGSIPPLLSNTSPNGVNGTWNPAVIDNMTTASYEFTPNSGQCASQQTIVVTVNPSSTLVDFQWTVTEAFAENQVITIDATAPGNYLYQLDYGPFQPSPVFERVSYGLHTVTVKDVAGCSPPITKNDILVVDFPKFFTPNGDGYNDTWNIDTLKDDLSAKIRVFDRYGKLLIEIYPNSGGWNGYYNNNPMPATDYWFVIEYEENSISKKLKSHFSLKR